MNKKNIEDILALTPMQEGLLFHYLKDRQGESYFNQLNLEVSGEIDLECFEKSWNLVIETNEMLRTVFRWKKLEKPIQVVLRTHTIHLKYKDLSIVEDSEEQKRQWEAIIQQDRSRQFDLREVPFRVTLGKMAQNHYRILISNHHILYDGWSTGIILKEFFQAYEALVKENQPLIPPVKPLFKEFIQWLQTRHREKQKKSWQNYLEGLDTPTRLPDKSYKQSRGNPGKRNYRLHLHQALKDKLEVWVKEKRVTLAAVFYCAWGILLQEYNNIDDVVFGTTISGRAAKVPGIENMVGLFINTIPLRVQTFPGEKTKDLLYRIDKALQMREEYETASLAKIIEYSDFAYHEEPFDSIVVIENYPLDIKSLQGNSKLFIESHSMVEGTHYDLTINITIAGDIEVIFKYNNRRFDQWIIERLSGHFVCVIQSMIERSGEDVSEIELIGEEEKRQILIHFNKTWFDYPADKPIDELFAVQVSKIPDYMALIGQIPNSKFQIPNKEVPSGRVLNAFAEMHFSYRELNEKSNQLARLLIKKGVKPGAIVGIILERSIEMIVGILAVLKAGAAYLPIDPDYPEERKNYMLQDSKAQALVVKDNSSASQLPFAPEALLNLSEGHHLDFPASQLPNFPASLPTSLAYVIYTSGSTGKPKGVMVEHRNVSYLVYGLRERIYKNYGENLKVCLVSPFVFDASVKQIFGALLLGNCLCIVPEEARINGQVLFEFYKKFRVDISDGTPAHLQLLMENKGRGCPGVRNYLIGGEPLSWKTAHGFLNRFVEDDPVITNVYGPTECTVDASSFRVNQENIGPLHTIPIGSPLPNCRIYVLARGNKLQLIGVPGELCIMGKGVSRGYLNRPELTAEKFDQDKSKKVPGKRIHMSYRSYKSYVLYKTGDLAKWLPDGNIEFLGRKDFQVKVRGFRIELGEIENQLLNHPGVKEAVVTAQTGRSGNHFLCAYVVPFIDKPFEISQLRHYLQQKLPNYMIPAHFVMLEAIPLTAAGKIDRKSLPQPQAKSTKEYLPPGNEIEKEMVKIWSDVLGINHQQIGIDDNFFELGGHSLKIAALIGRIYKELKIEVPFPGIFVRPTVRELAEYISRKEKTSYHPIPLVEEKEYYPLSSAQKRLYVLQQMDVDSVVYNLPGFMVVEGEVDKGKLERMFQGLVARHESLRTSFHIMDEETVQKIHYNAAFSIEYYDIKEIDVKVKEEMAPFGHILDAFGEDLATEDTGNTERKTIDPESQELRAKSYIYSFIRPFDLSQAPLLRVGLVTLLHTPSAHRGHPSQEGKKDKYLLMVEMHHIISDGFSMGILIKEFMTFYQGKKLPALRLQYKDFSQWHNSSREGEGLQAQENYWLRQLQGEIPVLNLPVDFSRPVVQAFEGTHTHFRIGKEETTALQAIALEENATVFGVLTSIFTIFLSRLSGQEDIVIGTPVTGRKHNDLSEVIGMFVNMLALRNFPSGDKTFQQFLEEARTGILEAQENQEYPFEELVERLALNRDVSRNPLFDAAFALQDPDMPRLEIPGLKVTPYEYDTRISKFDLTLIADQVEDQLHFTLQYCTKLFKTETIERFIEYFKQLVFSIVENPGNKISALDILPWQEKQRLLVEFNDIGADYPNDKMIPQLFREQVKRTPTSTAVVGIGQETGEPARQQEMAVTYSELDEKSNQLAHLLKRMGVQPDTVIGIRVERSIEMIIGILGILTAGCAYLPIDPESPQERINYMLKDSKAVFIVNQKFLQGGPGEAGVRRTHPGRRRQNISANLAYIIYTSGSSGKPKGVPITHSNFSPLIHWGYGHLGIRSKDRALQNLSYYFDWSVWEIFITLTTGASLYMVSQEVLINPEVCIEFINTHALTILHITPTHYGYLVNTGKPMKTLCYLFIGAEKLTYDLVKRSIEAVNPGCRIFNMYGPTEATIISAVLEIHRSRVDEYKELSSVPIGRPSGSTYLLVLDKYLKLCPVRAAGELYIGGEGVASGYLNNPELTAESFCLRRPGGALFEKTAPPGPPRKNFSLDSSGPGKGFHTLLKVPGKNSQKLLQGVQGDGFLEKSPPGRRRQKIYKTGDLTRWLIDGNVEFLGRIDHQVKIRGYRMELGEIENHLLNYPGIKEAVVAVKGNHHEKYLCAYIVPGNAVDQKKLKNALSKFLPDNMIPSYFIQVERMPLTPNKKIDLKALPEPTIPADRDCTAPANNIEKKLVEIWSGILDIERELISTNADFFQLGGHSLKATLLAVRIEKEFHAKVPLPEIFITPTIRELAEFLKHAQEFKFEPITSTEKKEYYPLSSAQRRLFVLQQMDEHGIGYNMPSIWKLQGNLDVEKFKKVFHRLIRRHKILRTSFIVVNDEPVQLIDDENYKLQITNKKERSRATQYPDPKSQELRAKSYIKNFIQPFDLSRAPLLRVGLIKLLHTPSTLRSHPSQEGREHKYLLMVDMHHIISDELSSAIFIKEFSDLYAGKRLPGLRLQYKDYSQWHNRQAESERMKEKEIYWLKQFEGEAPVLNLPTDFPRPVVQSFEGRTLHFQLDDEDNLALKQLARAEGATLFMILLALYSIFLSKVCSQEDLIIGTPIVCRNHIDLENMIGIFFNFLALRIFPGAEKSFKQILKEAKEQSTRAFENQDYPFEELVKQVEGERDSSHNPIFDVMLTMQEPISPGPGIPGLKLQPCDYENQTSKLDLSLQFTEMEPKVFYRFEYSTKLFRAETMEAFSRYFKTMVSSILKNPGLRLPDVEILPPEEKKHLLIDLNQTGREYPRNKMVSGLFAEQVERTPDKTAVRSAIQLQNIYDQLKPEDVEVEISYAELDESANQLAYQLREQGVGSDNIVALLVEHPLEKVIGIWGILKSGAAYLPIDPTYPQAVIKDILSDSQVRWFVSGSALASDLADMEISGHVLFIDEIEPHFSRLNPVSTPSPENLAYIIYTSGTTGKPKGTAIKQNGIVNYAWWRIHYFQFTEKDVTLQPLTYSFDSFCANFYPTLLCGGELVMVPDNRRLDFDYIVRLIREYQVTNVCFAPGLYNALLEAAGVKDLHSLRLVVLAGEASTPALLKKSREKVPQTRIANEYGPTEGTVAATCHPEIKETAVSMIGNPITNAKIYILNDSLQPVLPGAVGEICIAGIGVARGYLNRPELTAEKFCLRRPGRRILKKLPPWNPPQKILIKKEPGNRIHMSYMSYIYRTGDLGRWQRNEQGNWELEFLGRNDHQVKIRGHRIELEQVEALLSKHDKIKEAKVDIRGMGDNKYMCAYVVFKKVKDFYIVEINDYLQERLPYYMVPSRIVRVEKFPLTPNGKVDRKALPDPDFKPVEEYIAPRNRVEESLAQLWAEVLNIRKETIGIDTNFFDLGGHSLRATMLVSKIEKKLGIRIQLGHFFNAPTIRELSSLINTADNQKLLRGVQGGGFLEKNPPGRRRQDINPIEKRDYYPVSSQQKRLYTLRQFSGAGTAYNVFSVHCLKGNVEVALIEQSFQQLIKKHEAFRTGFRMIEGDLVQAIQDRVDWKLEYEELKNKEMAAYVKEFKREFDLSRPPILRITILKVETEVYLMLVDMHHIIADGVSTYILVNDLATAYEERELEPLTIQYKDYALWQREWLTGAEIRKQEAYWLKRYLGEIPVLNLHTDYARPQLQSFAGLKCDFRLSQSTTSELKKICQEYNVTLYMILLACYLVLLAKYSGQDDVVVGSPVAGRDHADTEGIVGMFANTLAFRSQPAGEKEFSSYLAEIKQISIEAYENQGYPFEELVEKVKITRDVSRNPLFDTMFVLQNIEMAPLKMSDIEIMPYRNEPDAARFDFIFIVSEFAKEISFIVEYCTRLFKEETINRLFMHYRHIVEEVLEEPGKKILAVEMVTPGEKEELLYDFNDTRAKYPANKTIQQLFEEQVIRIPDNIAVVGPVEMKYRSYLTYMTSISYRELNEKSNQMAYLLKERGALEPCIIGIMVERSIEMITGILGILKAGSAYLPIDSAYPEERILLMLADSVTSMLLTQGKIIDRHSIASLKNMKNRNILLLDEITGQMTQYPTENPEHMNQPDDLLYVIYTSGSTGKPKGVMLEHGNLVNLIYYQYNYTDIDFSRVLQFTTISFDVSAQEIFSTLLAGGRLSLVAKEILADVPALFERVEKDNIKTLFLPASFLKSVINEEDLVQLIPGSVRHVVTAGEQVVINMRFRQYLLENGVSFHNHYGPTETHVVTALTLDPAGKIPELPSIGKPVSNTGIYMLDKAKHLLPIGVPGELYIGGSQVGRGYLNNPQLTAERFCLRRPGGRFLKKLPPWTPRKNFSLKVPGIGKGFYTSHMYYMSYIYQTGDLAKWLPDGNIEFLGRIDQQVKIRGFRVELGEIESRLLDHPGIKDAVVQARVSETGERYLCAYIAPQLELSVSELGEYLSRGLPGYMIPSYFVQLGKIPLTPNGKIDRKALPAPGIKAGDHYKAPHDEIEKKLVDIWSEILGIEKEKISTDANFFHLGGHSLKATVLFSRVHKEFNVNIPLTEIFNTPHIRGLAAYIKESSKSKYIPIKAVEKKDYYPLSSAQRRLYILQQIDEDQGIGYNIPSVWQLEGNLDAGKFAAVFQQLIQRHESLRTFFTVVNDEPVQRIEDENPKFEIRNSKQIQNSNVQNLKQELAPEVRHFIQPFTLSQAPLLRVDLIKINDLKHVLMVDMHHIISDGVSIDIFIKEFIDLYAGKRLSALRLQYKDYSGWQSQQVQGERIKQQETFWINEFAGQVPVLDLPTDFSRPSMQSFAGGSICFETGKKETTGLKSLAHKKNVTLFMLLLSIYNVFLFKLSGQEDIVVGTPIAGRRHTDLETIIGMFVNTLALRNFPPGHITFIQFLEAVKERTIKAFDHQDYLYEDLVEQVTVERDTGRNPLFDTMFALQNADTHAIEIPGLNVTPYLNETPISKFDLTLTAVEGQENLFFTFEYCSKLFKKETIQRFIGYFNQVISVIVENEAIKLSGIEIIDEKEKNRVLYEFNNTAADYPKDKTIHQLFEEQVEQTPDHVALVGQSAGREAQGEDEKRYTLCARCCAITYRDLSEKSDQLAHLLIEKGVIPDTIVGIKVERSLELIIGIFSILKAGGAYLPIDPDYPPGRIDYMLKDSAAKILLTGQKIAGTFSPKALNTRLKGTSSFGISSRQGGQLAYVIYTSGSTGKPKGVMIGHKAVNNFITGITGQIPFKAGKVLLAVTTICFDIHILETLVPLCRGIQVMMADEQQQRDGNLLAASLLKHHIDMLQVTPSRMRMLPGVGHGHDVSCLKHLKEIMVGGEPFPVELLEKLKKLTFARIYNMYGPTETTIWSSVEELTHVDEITIGRPITNTQIYILDKKQNLQPVGVAGELCIGGDGIAWGYINQPGLTCEKFDQDLWDCQDYHDEKLLQGVQGDGFLEKSPPGRRRQKIYKTGDLARWLMDGRIEFFGRIDNQVKIRGFRIELGEIECQLLAHEKIKETVVIAREDSSSNKCLCAYIVLMQGESIAIDQTEFRRYLTNRLPDYMVPSFFVHLDKIPLTSNGKIDRKALPAPEIKAGDNYEPPRSELEERLVEIWQEVLGVEQVGINDNFFQLGGHSLKAIQIVSLFEKEGIHMNVGDLFRYSNIKTLVEIKSVPRVPFQENGFIEQTVEKVECCSEKEKENILEMLEKSIREFSDAILEGKVKTRYPLSAMQKAYLRLSRRSAGTLMAFNGYPNQDRLCDAIIKTTAEQGLLRSRMNKEDSDLLWYEHEMPVKLQVPFVDLSHFGIEVADEITRVIAARYFLNRDINLTILPYRVILIKKNMRDHMVVFAADHTIYDALTGQILKTNLENFYHHGEAFVKMGTPFIRGYDEYVNQVSKGPQQVNQDKIIRTFELEEFKNSMAEVNRVFKANRSNRFVNHEITIPLKDTSGHFDDKMPLEISLRIYVSLCKVFFGVEKVPLLFFSFGRKYQDKEFFDTVGEFTDLVPILVNSNENILAKIEEKIAFASKHNINFMSTLMSEKMSAKWKKVTDLLSPDGIGYDWNLLRFNFTGKTGDIELDRVKENIKNMEIRDHPSINDVELDGVTVMASYNNERLKIEVGFNMEVDQAEFRESIRLITRQMEDLKDLTLVCEEDDYDKNIKR